MSTNSPEIPPECQEIVKKIKALPPQKPPPGAEKRFIEQISRRMILRAIPKLTRTNLN